MKIHLKNVLLIGWLEQVEEVEIKLKNKIKTLETDWKKNLDQAQRK